MRKKTNSGFKKVLMIYGGVLLVLIATCIIVYIVYNNKIKVITDEGVTVEKLTQLDKVFGKEGYIKARDGGLLHIHYKL